MDGRRLCSRHDARAADSPSCTLHARKWPSLPALALAAQQRTSGWGHNVVMKRPIALALVACTLVAHAERVGEVDTVFKLIGPDHKIVVDAYDDPEVRGVTCYVSRAKTGGIAGGLGLAEDKAEASIACRQTGPISFPKPLKQEDEMFSERISLVFKRLRVVRMVDSARNTLVYLTYSDRVIEGSPQNSVTAVPVDRATPIPVRK